MNIVYNNHLSVVPWKQFESFYNSLDNEKKTWDLDMNLSGVNCVKDWYNLNSNAKNNDVAVVMIDNEIIGFSHVMLRDKTDEAIFNRNFETTGHIPIISFVVKEKYWGNGIGTLLIKNILKLVKYDLYTAVVDRINIGSYKAFIKNNFICAGFNGNPNQFLMIHTSDSTKQNLFKRKMMDQPKIINYLKQDILTLSPLTHCISSFNNLNYLKLAVKSIRENSFYVDAPLIIHAENCQDGTNEWLQENSKKLNFEYYIEKNKTPRGIGGGMNFCASKVQTKFINFLHADFYVAKDWDKHLLEKFNKYPNQRMIVFSHRVQPNIFKEESRSGTLIVPMDEFGEYHHNFDKQYFLDWADEFSQMNDFEIQKSEGVSGLIRKVDWDFIGGNDDRFAPAYWEDADLFIRMINESYKFVLTSKSVVYHFASRASRFPDDDLTIRPTNLADIEKRSTQRFAEKYGRLPDRDEHDFYIPLQIIDGSPNRINQ